MLQFVQVPAAAGQLLQLTSVQLRTQLPAVSWNPPWHVVQVDVLPLAVQTLQFEGHAMHWVLSEFTT